MKKLMSLLLTICSIAFSALGQAFDKDTKVIAAGVGLGSSLGSFNYSSQLPGLSLQYEQGMWEAGNSGVISLGGYVGYKSFTFKTNAGNISMENSWNYTILGIRSAYHFQGLNNDKIDLYGGAMISYNILKYKYSDSLGTNTGTSGNYGSTAGLTLYGGVRYFFSPKAAGFAELGYGVSYLNLGLAFKL